MAGWAPADMPDLNGTRALVTGANSGLGLQTSLELARRGAYVLLGCRDSDRAARARDEIASSVPAAALEILPLDLADLSSVREAAARVVGDDSRLDVLVNNAGVMAIPRRTTVDGFEMQLGTNHLGHFALTGLVLPALLRRPGARVVTLSSIVHRRGRIDIDDLMGETRYSAQGAYGQSKLDNLLFAAELDRRARAAGADLLSVAAHPGYAATNLQSVGPAMSGNRLLGGMMKVGNALVAQSDAAGAWPTEYAATMPDVTSGEYFGPGGPAELRGHPRRASRSAAAADLAMAGRLWTASERLTEVTYAF